MMQKTQSIPPRGCGQVHTKFRFVLSCRPSWCGGFVRRRLLGKCRMTKSVPNKLPVLDDSDSELLLCNQESLDRKSPELWPEKIPGVTNFTPSAGLLNDTAARKPELPFFEQLKDDNLGKEDIEMLQEFGSLTMAQLMEKVRSLQNMAYQVGVDEARQMMRGKFLDVLGDHRRGKKPS